METQACNPSTTEAEAGVEGHPQLLSNLKPAGALSLYLKKGEKDLRGE